VSWGKNVMGGLEGKQGLVVSPTLGELPKLTKGWKWLRRSRAKGGGKWEEVAGIGKSGLIDRDRGDQNPVFGLGTVGKEEVD